MGHSIMFLLSSFCDDVFSKLCLLITCLCLTHKCLCLLYFLYSLVDLQWVSAARADFCLTDSDT